MHFCSYLFTDLPEKVSCVTISKVQKYADLYGATKEGYERFLAVILDDVSHKRDRNPLKVLPALPKSPSSVTHCLAVWLAVRAESPSSAVTWEEFVEMTRNLGLDESIIVQEQRLLVATSSLKPLNYEHNGKLCHNVTVLYVCHVLYIIILLYMPPQVYCVS